MLVHLLHLLIQPLEYSDLLLATATAKWETLDARSENHDFTGALLDVAVVGVDLSRGDPAIVANIEGVG